MTIDHGIRFVCRQWLKIRNHRTSTMEIAGIAGTDCRPIDFLWDIARVSLYDRKDRRVNTMNPL